MSTLCRFPLCVVSRVSVTLHLLLCNDSRSHSPGMARFSLLHADEERTSLDSSFAALAAALGGRSWREGYEHFYGFDLYRPTG